MGLLQNLWRKTAGPAGAAQNSVATPAPQIGDVMPEGHANAGWIFMGREKWRGREFYAAPQDESGRFSFNTAARQAQKAGAQVPTPAQLRKMLKNKEKGALKGTFNIGGVPDSAYRDSGRTLAYVGAGPVGRRRLYTEADDLLPLRLVRT